MSERSELIDTYSLFMHYKTIFKIENDNNSKLLFNKLTSMQEFYNENYNGNCSGMKFMKLKHKPPFLRYCHKSVCPSCFHRGTIRLLRTLQESDHPYYYLRKFPEISWHESIIPQLRTRFMGRSTDYKLLGYSIGFPFNIESFEDYKDQEALNPIYDPGYVVYGVFWSNEPLVQIDKEHSIRAVGVEDLSYIPELDQRRFTNAAKEHIVDYIFDILGHPFLSTTHPDWEDFMVDFMATTPMGRRWSCMGRSNQNSSATKEVRKTRIGYVFQNQSG